MPGEDAFRDFMERTGARLSVLGGQARLGQGSRRYRLRTGECVGALAVGSAQ